MLRMIYSLCRHFLPIGFVLAYILQFVPPVFCQTDYVSPYSEILEQQGHSFRINDIAFSRDSKLLITGADDKFAIVWTVDDGLEVARLRHESAVRAVVLSFDSRGAFTAEEGRIWRWDFLHGYRKTLVAEEGSTWVARLELSPDGGYLVAHRANELIRVFESISPYREVVLTEEGRSPRSIAFSRSGRTCAVFDGKHTIVWNLTQRSVIRRIPGTALGYSADDRLMVRLGDNIYIYSDDERALLSGGNGTIESVALSARGDRVVIRYHNNQVAVVDLTTPSSSTVVMEGSGIVTIAGNLVAIYNDPGTIKLYDKDTVVSSLLTRIDVKHIAIASNASTLELVSASGLLQIYDVPGLKLLGTIDAGSNSEPILSPDGQYVAFVQEDSVGLVPVKTPDLVRRLSGTTSTPWQLQLSNDKTLLIVSDVSTHVWSLRKGGIARTFPGHGGVLSPDGRHTATAIASDVVIWNNETGAEEARLKSRGGVSDIVYTPDGSAIITASAANECDDGSIGNSIVVWDVVSLRRIHCLAGRLSRITGLAISPDSKLLLSASGGTEPDAENSIGLWDIASGIPLAQHTGLAFPPTAVSFAHKVPLALVASDDVTIVEIPSLRPIKRLTIGALVPAAVFGTGDGSVIVGTSDGHVEFVDLASGQTIKKLDAHDNDTISLSLSADGQMLASGGADNIVKLWIVSQPTVQSDVAKSMTGSVRELCRLVSASDQWVVVTPDQRFDTSNLDNVGFMHWVRYDDPLRAAPLSLLSQQYFEPSLLSRVLGGETFPRITGTATLNLARPATKILRVTAGAREGSVDITVEIKEGVLESAGKKSRSGAKDLKVFRDNQLVAVYPAQGGDISLDPVTGSKTVTLRDVFVSPAGRSNVEISAYAFSKDGVRGDIGRTQVSLSLSNAESRLKPKAYIASIGCTPNSRPIPWVRHDAVLFAEVIRESLIQSSTYLAVEVTTLLDAECTRSHVLQIFNDLRAQTKPEDVVFVYLAGIAVVGNRGEFNFVPSDASEMRPEQLISGDVLSAALQGIDARVVTLIDAASEDISPGKEGISRAPATERGLAQLAFDKRFVVIASYQPISVAIELQASGPRLFDFLAPSDTEAPKAASSSLFAYALLNEGILEGKADRQPRSGRVSLADLLKYVESRVPELGGQLGARSWYPVVFNFNAALQDLSLPIPISH